MFLLLCYACRASIFTSSLASGLDFRWFIIILTESNSSAIESIIILGVCLRLLDLFNEKIVWKSFSLLASARCLYIDFTECFVHSELVLVFIFLTTMDIFIVIEKIVDD